MTRLTNLEPTANGAQQETNWKRKGAERVNYLLGAVDDVVARVSAAEQGILALEEQAASLRSDLDALSDRVAAVEARMTSAEQVLAEHTSKLDDHEARIRTLEADAEA